MKIILVFLCLVTSFLAVAQGQADEIYFKGEVAGVTVELVRSEVTDVKAEAYLRLYQLDPDVGQLEKVTSGIMAQRGVTLGASTYNDFVLSMERNDTQGTFHLLEAMSEAIAEMPQSEDPRWLLFGTMWGLDESEEYEFVRQLTYNALVEAADKLNVSRLAIAPLPEDGTMRPGMVALAMLEAIEEFRADQGKIRRVTLAVKHPDNYADFKEILSAWIGGRFRKLPVFGENGAFSKLQRELNEIRKDREAVPMWLPIELKDEYGLVQVAEKDHIRLVLNAEAFEFRKKEGSFEVNLFESDVLDIYRHGDSQLNVYVLTRGSFRQMDIDLYRSEVVELFDEENREILTPDQLLEKARRMGEFWAIPNPELVWFNDRVGELLTTKELVLESKITPNLDGWELTRRVRKIKTQKKMIRLVNGTTKR